MGAERLGRYMVLRHLASGGMADVLLGRSDGIEGFERHVVVKRIRAEHAKDQRFIQMFLDEARLAATLHHQNVIQVYDIGEDHGEYFFAMEYVHGEDLRTILSVVSKSRTHMPLGYVAAIISSAAAGLHYAHERRGSDKKPLNIVHRDVSPSNIIIGYDGAVKVLDFGIAKAASRAVETRSGSLKGKVSYMSPEQCKGDSSIDRRSDVYSLGVVLYELATTSRLFKGDSDYLLMDSIVNGKVPLPRVKRPDLPNELSSIIMRALSVDPARRFQTADELRIALDQYAVKANLTASTSALSSYMTKLFGEKTEPWLENSVTMVDSASDKAKLDLVRNSWTEIPRDAVAAAAGLHDPYADTSAGLTSAATTPGIGDPPSSDNAKTRTDGKRRRNSSPAIVAAIGHADTMPPPFKDVPSTSTKLAWENQGELPAAPEMRLWTKLALIAIPVLIAVIGIGVWRFVLSGHTDHGDQVATSSSATPKPAALPAPKPGSNPAEVVVTPAPPPAPAVAPVPPPAPPPREVGPATHDATIAKPATVPAPKKPTSTGKQPTKSTTKAEIKTTPTPTTVPPVAPVVAATPPAGSAAAPVVEPPKDVEPIIANLSGATISAVASDHAKQLAKCEGGTDLHGDITIAFQIDTAGKVVKSQLGSTIKNPKIAGCVLAAVRGWQFPKPPSGAAKGVYSINYQ